MTRPTAEHVPTVSVVVPVHNGARFLASTLDSVLAQTFRDFELVLADDASTDASAAIISRYDDPRIRVLYSPQNLGFGGNWNRCLAEAGGEFIKLLPQDDLLHCDCLAAQVDALRSDTKGTLAMVFSARRIIDPNGNVLLGRSLGSNRQVLTRALTLRRVVRSGTNPVGEPGAVLFRRSAAIAAGAFDGTLPFVIDLDYWLRLLAFGDALYLPETLSSFRVSTQSHSVSLGKRQATEFAAFLKRIDVAHGGPLRRTDVMVGGLMAYLQGVARMTFQQLTIARTKGLRQ